MRNERYQREIQSITKLKRQRHGRKEKNNVAAIVTQISIAKRVRQTIHDY